MELDQRIKQEIEENPALEEGADEIDDEFDNEEYDDRDDNDNDDEFDISDYLDDDPDYKTQISNKGRDEEEK